MPARLSLPFFAAFLSFLVACGEAPHLAVESPAATTASAGLLCGAGGSSGSGGASDAQKGAYVVLLNGSPQTQGNALKPYGLVYDLVSNAKVPVLWAYRTDKTANTDVDFTVD